MNGLPFLRLLCVWLTAAALVVAPLAAVPAFAQTSTDSVMSSMMDDMPCCPDEPGNETPQPNKCKDCPAMFLCSFNSLQGFVPFDQTAFFFSELFAELTPGVAAHLNDIGSSPPSPPPRS